MSRSRYSKVARTRRQVSAEPLEGRVLLSAQLVADLVPGSGSSNPTGLAEFNGTLLFSAKTPQVWSLYRSDGTAAGTTPLRSLSGPATAYFQDGGIEFFSVGSQLWRTDGTGAGTFQLSTPGVLTGAAVLNGTFYFLTAPNYGGPVDLYQSDGTAAGTVLVKDLPQSSGQPGPHGLVASAGKLYFLLYDSMGTQLYASDGTAAGTGAVKTLPSAPPFQPDELADVNGTVYFTGPISSSTFGLWRSDGTASGTVPVVDSGNTSMSQPKDLTSIDGGLYFFAQASDGSHLFHTDPSRPDFYDIGHANPPSPQNVFMVSLGGTVILSADAGVGVELYKATTTPNSLALLDDIDPGNLNPNSSRPDNFTRVGNEVFFTATDRSHGADIWQTDGTAAGTSLAASFQGSVQLTQPRALVAVNGTLYFSASDSAHGAELYALTTPLSAPTGVSATALSDTQIRVNWTDSQGNQTGFILEKSTDGNNFSQLAEIDDPSASSYTDGGLTASTKYYYRVRAITFNGETFNSPVVSATTQPLVPLAPSNLTVAPVAGSATSLRLTWADNSGNETGFRIERSTDGTSFAQVAVADANAASFVDGGLTPATLYYYRVRATNSHGDSVYSNVGSATTFTAESPFTGTPAAVPGLLQAEDFDNGSNSIAYSDTTPGNSGGQYRTGTDVDIVAVPTGGYAIDQSVGEWTQYTVQVPASGTYNLEFRVASASSGNALHLASDASDLTGALAVPNTGSVQTFRTITFPAVSLTGGTHVLRLSLDSANTGDVNVDWVRMLNGSAVRPPAAPASLAAFAINGPAVDLTWAPTDGSETGFRILRKGPADTAYQQVGWADTGATRFTDASAAPLTSYTYEVIATNSAGDSPAPGPVPVTTLDVPGRQLNVTTSSDGDSNPTDFVRFGDAVYFIASGNQLWKSDATAGGTVLLVGNLASLSQLTVSGNALYFVTGDQTRTLWKSDGTAAGTAQVPGIVLSPDNSQSNNLTPLPGGKLVFTSGLSQVYATDGTQAGTVLVKQFTATNARMMRFTPSGGLVYFGATESGLTSLWRTDGTPDGTLLVITPDPIVDNGFYPENLTDVNGTLYFSDYGNQRTDVYRSDGTPSGTVPVTSAMQFEGVTSISHIGDTVYFATIVAGGAAQLASTDGTVAGSRVITPLGPGSDATSLADVGGRLFMFVESVGPKLSLWISDGTAAGTVPVSALPSAPTGFPPQGFFDSNGVALFMIPTPNERTLLWRSDGTPSGTFQVALASGIPPLSGLSGKVFFGGYDRHSGWEPYVSNGTPSGTNLLKDINVSTAGVTTTYRLPRYLTDVGGTLYFVATSGTSQFDPTVLFKSDGTDAGTVPVSPLITNAFNLHRFGNRLLFMAPFGMEEGLYSTDGTEQGTRLVAELFESLPRFGNDPDISAMYDGGGKAYFVIGGDVLWVTDGTPAGTMLIGGGTGSYSFEGADLNGSLIYTLSNLSAQGGTIDLWKTDGTPSGTVEIRSFQPGPTGVIAPLYMTPYGGNVYFRAGDGAWQLWRTDGTLAGTAMVSPVYPVKITASNGKLFFYGATGGFYASDGTTSGTVQLATLPSNINFPFGDGQIVSFNGHTWFVGETAQYQAALWESDGTPQGTFAVTPYSQSVNGLTVVDHVLMFGRDQSVWFANGVGDPQPVLSSIGGVPLSLSASGGRLFFAAPFGQQLWTAYAPAPGPVLNVTDVSDSGVTLAWTAAQATVSATSAIVIERRVAPDGAYVAIADLPADATTYRDTTVRPGTWYQYRVRAVNAGGSSPSVAATAVTFGVVNRQVFYNDSAADGNDPAADARDDAAVAADKRALLPGQAAGFANYTTYSKGINGIMIDIAGLPPGVVTADDFALKIGTGGDPATWVAAPAPAAVTVRRLYGLAGTDRIEITWPDEAIRNEWLQVTVKADARTGLRSDDVFYFGNLTGDVNGDGSVNFPDLLALAQQYGHAPMATTTADLNFDGSVNFADLLVLAQAYGQRLSIFSAPPPISGGGDLGGSTAVAWSDTQSRQPRGRKARGVLSIP